jgi:hypothetical protein
LLENVPQVAEGHVTVQLERRIAHLEQCIDHAVYALYGLSEQEVTIVESSLAQ